MLIKGAKVFCDDGVFRITDVSFNDQIISVGHQKGDGINADGDFLIPGLIDIHTHGAMGADTCDGTAEQIEKMSRFYAKNGVTAFCATTMSFDETSLTSIVKSITDFSSLSGSKCLGINMEGPFINPLKKGAHALISIVAPDYEMFNRIYSASKGIIRLVNIAPEHPDSVNFIRKVSKMCTVSLAHTDADYKQSMDAFRNGATHVTHLFNAMPPFLHRSPGVVGAAIDSDCTVELICDGIHLHPAVIRSMFRLFGKDRVCLISDSMRSSGLHDGNYDLGGQTVHVREGKASLKDGTLAGSVINLMTAVKNVISYGIESEIALTAATINPARVVGADDYIGSLTPGKASDMVLLDTNWNIKSVYIDGRRVH